MANAITNVPLLVTPLTTADATGLLASVRPQASWQPTFLLETQRGMGYVPGQAGLTTAGDMWRFNIHPPSNMPDLAFLPVALRANFWFDGAYAGGVQNFFELTNLVSINFNTEETWYQYCFERGTLEGPTYWWDDQNLKAVMTLNTGLQGYPPPAGIAERTTPAANALAVLCFKLKTWHAETGVGAIMNIDARFLGFPRAALKSAGFYMPYLYP